LRQFDVFANPSEASRGFAPYLAVLQSHHLSAISTVVVAPLVRDAEAELTVLDVPVEFEGETLILAVAELGSVDQSRLKEPVGSVAEQEDMIRRALDRLLTGF